jgi:hypothetical protein
VAPGSFKLLEMDKIVMHPAEPQKVFEYEWMFHFQPCFYNEFVSPSAKQPSFSLFFCEQFAFLTAIKMCSGHNNFLVCSSIIQFENDLAIQLILAILSLQTS